MGLQDLPMDVVERALAAAIRSCRFMPAVLEIRELAGVPSDQDAALIAWMTFERAVEQVGGYASVDFEDKAINATVRSLGGWERLCGLPPEEFDKWLRKDFLVAYTSVRRTGVMEGMGAALGGICDRENSALGYRPTKPPVAIPSLRPESAAPRLQAGSASRLRLRA